MSRRGFTLVEILVATLILGIVAGMTMTVFQYQNRNWKTESDKAETAMMAKGVIDEMSSMIRMTGGGLPECSIDAFNCASGLKVWGAGEERVTFVFNSTNFKGVTLSKGEFDPSTGRLKIAVDSAIRFNPKGYAAVEIKKPYDGAPYNTIPEYPLSQLEPHPFTLGVLDRIGGCGKDTLVLDASYFTRPPYSYTWNAIGVDSNSTIWNLDSVTFRKSHDTLWTKWNRLDESVFALGVDTLRLQYWHPATGWNDSLSGAAPKDRIDKVRIRIVLRSRKVDQKLLSQRPATRGYRFTVLETEVSLRNENLKNK